MAWLYIALAGAAGLTLLAFFVWLQRTSRARRGDDLGPLPLTTLQKRAWIALACGVVTMVALVAVFATGGIDRYDHDPGTRLLVYLLLAAGAVIHWFVLPRRLDGRPKAWADERDLRIFERAPAIQGLAVLVVLAVWAIALTETYDAAGAIPLVFPSLILLSSFFVHLVSISFALLLGYRRSLADA